MTLIDALKGLHSQMNEQVCYQDEPLAHFTDHLAEIIAEHERSGEAEPALVRNDVQTNLGRIAADIEICMRQINPQHEVHAVLAGCRCAILANAEKAKDWQPLPKGPA